MSNMMRVKGFSEEPEIYDESWSTEPLEVSKLVQYLAFDRVVRLPQWAIPPPDAPEYTITCRTVRDVSNTYHYTIYHDWGTNVSATKVFKNETKKIHEKLVYDESTELPDDDRAQLLHEIAATDVVNESFIKCEEGQLNASLYPYPKNQFTFRQTSLNPENSSLNGDYFWSRSQLCTNRLAMEVHRKILTEEVHLDPLPFAPLEPSESGELIEYLSTENKMRHWATVTQEHWKPLHRKVTITHEHDDTVVAFFRKDAVHKDNKVPKWKLVSARDFEEAALELNDSKTTTWKYWMEEIAVSIPGLMRKGPGSMYVEQVDTGFNYHIVDPERVLRDDQIRKEDALSTTFPEGEGTWKMARALSFPRGEYWVEKLSVAIWARVSDENIILERLVAKTLRADYASIAWKTAQAYGPPRPNLVDVQAYNSLTPNQRYPDSSITQVRGFADQGYINVDHGFEETVFLEYCSEGDLLTLIKYFREQGRRMPEEGFVWLLFRNLTRACQAIEAAGKVHPKITLDNIFLRERPETGWWRAYPCPVLGGLGNVEDIENISGRGEQGFYTPEQIEAKQEHGGPNLSDVEDGPKQESDGPSRKRVIGGHKLHVYAIGICVWSAMRRRTNGMSLRRGESKIHIKDRDSTFSARLEELVKECLEPDIQARMSLDELAERVNTGIQALKTIKPNIDKISEGSLPREDRVPHRIDEFAVGAQFDEGARRRVKLS